MKPFRPSWPARAFLCVQAHTFNYFTLLLNARPPPWRQDFVVIDAGYPKEGLKALNIMLLPIMAQPIVPIYNLGPSVTMLV